MNIQSIRLWDSEIREFRRQCESLLFHSGHACSYKNLIAVVHSAQALQFDDTDNSQLVMTYLRDVARRSPAALRESRSYFKEKFVAIPRLAAEHISRVLIDELHGECGVDIEFDYEPIPKLAG